MGISSGVQAVMETGGEADSGQIGMVADSGILEEFRRKTRCHYEDPAGATVDGFVRPLDDSTGNCAMPPKSKTHAEHRDLDSRMICRNSEIRSVLGQRRPGEITCCRDSCQDFAHVT
jgi:hypothetical protein